jgi:hypothetical protein
VWVHPSVSTLTVAPHKEAPVAFTVNVPAGASAGDHLAGLAVENADPQTSGGGFQIKEIIRAVVGIQIRVPGPAVFHPHISGMKLERLAGPNIAAVIVRLGDDGLALGKPKLTVSLSGPAGYHRSITRTLDTLLPGDIIDYPFQWPDSLPKGAYDITASLTGGGVTATLNNTFQLDKDLVGAAVAAAPRPPVPANHSGGGVPWWPFAVAAAGILAGVILRRRPTKDRPTPLAGPSSYGGPGPEPASDPQVPKEPASAGR